uniref:Putative retrotransposon protein n=1 Tax=Phyllostachys edulis TaxID=38705 RepID=D3IVR6_PHYED|nr:putative retrotransposon protein [Phyllostachys edulis]
MLPNPTPLTDLVPPPTTPVALLPDPAPSSSSGDLVFYSAPLPDQVLCYRRLVPGFLLPDAQLGAQRDTAEQQLPPGLLPGGLLQPPPSALLGDAAIASSIHANALESCATKFGQIQAQLCRLQASSSRSTSFTAPSRPMSGASLLWVLDSRASFHVTSDAFQLISYRSAAKGTNIQTVDGTPCTVTHQETLSTSHFAVSNVSLVPTLSINLISVGQLTNMNCFVGFDDSFFVQDRRTRVVIGTGHRVSHQLLVGSFLLRVLILNSRVLVLMLRMILLSGEAISTAIISSTVSPLPSFRASVLVRSCTEHLLTMPIFVYLVVCYVLLAPLSKPSIYQEATNILEWQLAMTDELTALECTGSWDLVPLPSGVVHITCKWVYKVKTKSDGSVERYKASLVARGFQQRYARGLLSQMDVKNIFLHGDLHEEVYMQPPQACSIWSLSRLLVFLFERFSSVIRAAGFTPNDMLITRDDMDYVAFVKKKLSEQFMMSYLRPLSYFLGIEVHSDGDGNYLSQHRYVQYLLPRSGMIDTRNAATPKELHLQLRPTDDAPLIDLVYLTVTRSYIAHVVHVLSQFVSAPTSVHYDHILRVLRYLRGTASRRLFYVNSSQLQLHAYSNSTWASDPVDRRYITGYCISLVTSLID